MIYAAYEFMAGQIKLQ